MKSRIEVAGAGGLAPRPLSLEREVAGAAVVPREHALVPRPADRPGPGRGRMTNSERHRDPEASLLRRYLQEIGRYKQLTPDEEKELGRRIQATATGGAAPARRGQPPVRRRLRQALPPLPGEPSRPHQRGQHRADPGGPQVRPRQERQVHHLCRVVDPPGDPARPLRARRHLPPAAEAGEHPLPARALRQALGRELERTPTESELAEELGHGPGRGPAPPLLEPDRSSRSTSRWTRTARPSSATCSSST